MVGSGRHDPSGSTTASRFNMGMPQHTPSIDRSLFIFRTRTRLVGLRRSLVRVLSLQAQQNINHERQRLHHHWQQSLERAAQEAQRAERQYQAVEPENRLVARSLEQRWEVSLRTQCALQEEYNRFLQDQPRQLNADEKGADSRTGR